MSTPKPSFTVEDLLKIIGEDPAKLKEIFEAMNKTAKAERDDQKIVNAIVKLGFKEADVVLLDTKKTLAQQPDVTVLTYSKWMEVGRKVKPGEKALKLGKTYHINLFHKSQTEIATTAERKAYHKKMSEAAAKREAKTEQAQA